MDASDYRKEQANKQREQARGTYTIEMIGKRCTLKKRRHRYSKLPCKARGPIIEFSRKARARKLRRIAEVNWKDTGDVQFITVTYPDDVADHTMEQRKIHRYLLNRWICELVGRPLACFWRVEWEPRKSGRNLGKLLPHMHFLYLDCPRICEMRIRMRWMSILGVKQYTQVKIKHLLQPEKVAVYVAKYCAKEASVPYLDSVPKRNRTGRHSGELRKALIPLHELEVVEKVDTAIVLFLKRRASEVLWWFDPRFDEGFTVLGQEALDLIRDIHENYLAYKPAS